MFFDVFSLDMHSRYPQLMAACWFFDKPLSWGLWGILFGCYLREYGCEKHINKIPLSFSSGYSHSTWLKLLRSRNRRNCAKMSIAAFTAVFYAEFDVSRIAVSREFDVYLHCSPSISSLDINQSEQSPPEGIGG